MPNQEPYLSEGEEEENCERAADEKIQPHLNNSGDANEDQPIQPDLPFPEQDPVGGGEQAHPPVAGEPPTTEQHPGVDAVQPPEHLVSLTPIEMGVGGYISSAGGLLQIAMNAMLNHPKVDRAALQQAHTDTVRAFASLSAALDTNRGPNLEVAKELPKELNGHASRFRLLK